MKKSFLIYIILFYSLSAFAQTISVSSFKLLETDLTANTAGTMETDQNGETAALIKVVATQTGFTFDGGSLGIVKTIQKPSEIWVYVPRGLKKITISHPQLGMLRDHYLNIPIEAARTYEMVLIIGETQKTRSDQFVVFKLDPKDAVVDFDSEILATEKGIASKKKKLGKYQYRIQALDCFPEIGTIAVDGYTDTLIVNIALKQKKSQKDSYDTNSSLGFDGDPDVSGSTDNIHAIVRSIADGDAWELANLVDYPISRKYPLKDIKDPADMVKQFNDIFDERFREKISRSTDSDWHAYGWRGYYFDEQRYLWVYDLLTVIDYYSPLEQKRREDLISREMASLDSSLNGEGWKPFCCYRDKTNSSIIRIDIRERKKNKKKNYHVDGVALIYPQLQAYKLRGDEEFRMSIYSDIDRLNEKPSFVFTGYADIGGSANMTDYIFNKGKDMEIFLGDSYYENGIQTITFKKKSKENVHHIECCYWLDLIN